MRKDEGQTCPQFLRLQGVSVALYDGAGYLRRKDGKRPFSFDVFPKILGPKRSVKKVGQARRELDGLD